MTRSIASPLDADGLADQGMASVQKHVSEVWSPPRVTKLAGKFGLNPGFAYDSMINDESGNPWGFDTPEQRAKCLKHVMEQQPEFLSLHRCAQLPGALQGLNTWRMHQALNEQNVSPA